LSSLKKGVTREKPEQVFVLWVERKTMPANIQGGSSFLMCDHCNKQIDLDPFPVIDYPSDEELADPDYIPAGDEAFCRSCAIKEYGLKSGDAGNVDRLWICFDVTKTGKVAG